ncbi:nucleotidyltransferase family protein [Compostimonas suwonensis]|uniref:Putative nucleotidyltransferase-like protein n=1 Tax=Compostimonas suwonensis TaxID=1048394 RepID=A0A2M9C543_9MICO|nr:nucleotidyltransferase family protein [Compostimonas suwonensis]PJJ65650.1 putative nucleotidyltransferase-like protein [Compostimonas suwonensis]
MAGAAVTGRDGAPEPAVLLQRGEAVELAHALIDRVARARGIRALFIKGPSLALHGLRPPRVSADVDVLVDPLRFDELFDALVSLGWSERPSTFASRAFTTHSRTLVADGWPCDIDAHHRFPGFLADPAVVFEALWRRRTTMRLAGVRCEVPDRAGSILILALHSLRSSTAVPRHRGELDHLIGAVGPALSETERADLAELALETGSVATLDSVLPALGVDARATPEELAAPEALEWRRRVAAGAPITHHWLSAVMDAPWRGRPRLLLHALWPSAHDLRLDHPDIAPGSLALLRARWQRLGRGLDALPAVLRARRRA